MVSVRKFITLALAVLIAFAALSTGQAVRAQDKKLSGKLEIFSWWAGDEGPALEALLKLYKTKYPDVEVTNATVSGGSGTNARAVLKTRMLGGDPPDSFQVHAGQELIGTHVVAGRMEPLTALFKSEGWTEKMPKDLIDLLSYNGDIWSVPVNIHRSNVLWYIPDKLKEWGVEVPKTWGDFLKTCDALKAKKVTPLAMGENWTAQHLFENVLLGELGVDDYRALWAGKLKWTDDKVVKAWETFGKVLDCTNSDAASLSWQQASDLVIGGKAAFNVMGDWAAGYYTTTKKLEPGKGYGWAAAPGTSGVFNMLSDSFGLPKGVKNKDNVIAWLKLLGSVEGQDAFNPLKGSIPARTDADTKNAKLYNAYLQSAAADFASNKIVGSLTHGAVAPESFTNDFSTVLATFLADKNAKTASATAQSIADKAMAGMMATPAK
jgi:glucose/mannose transport system substrate-binding protein